MTRIFTLHTEERHGGSAVSLHQTEAEALEELVSMAIEYEQYESDDDRDADAPTTETVIEFLVDRGWTIDIQAIDLPAWLMLTPAAERAADTKRIATFIRRVKETATCCANPVMVLPRHTADPYCGTCGADWPRTETPG